MWALRANSLLEAAVEAKSRVELAKIVEQLTAVSLERSLDDGDEKERALYTQVCQYLGDVAPVSLHGEGVPHCVADKTELIPAFVQSRGLVKHHITSFDDFVDNVIPAIFRANSRVKSKTDPQWYLQFKSIRIGGPELEGLDVSQRWKSTPQRCRLASRTYSAPIFVRCEYVVNGEVHEEPQEVQVGSMPIMLRSKHCVLYGKSDKELAALGECPLDPGGYFIVDGRERAILMQEQLAKNRIIVTEDASKVISASIMSSRTEIKSRTSVLYRKNQLYVSSHSFAEDIPLFIVMRATGIPTMQQCSEYVGTESSYLATMYFSLLTASTMEPPIDTQQEALRYIGARVQIRSAVASKETQAAQLEERGRYVLNGPILSHFQSGANEMRRKGIFLGVMARRALAASLDKSMLDDREFYGNKRLELAGDMMALLFENVWKIMLAAQSRYADVQLKRGTGSAAKVTYRLAIDRSTLSNGLKHSIRTGNWRFANIRMDRSGVTQTLSRMTYLSTLGMLTRISSQFEKTRKISGPRALQPSQWGLVCPSDTPEGDTCGLVKNLALFSHITISVADEPIINLVLSFGTEDCCSVRGAEFWVEPARLVYVSGKLVGYHKAPGNLVANMRNARRCGKLSPFVSISTSEKSHCVLIGCDGGRLCRPLIVVSLESGRPMIESWHCERLRSENLTFDECVAQGLVEFLDCAEEDNASVALYERDIVPGQTTHLEIEPVTILGIVAGLIPFPHHNQSPRNTYQCAMGKQAMGFFASNQMRRMDNSGLMLAYSQKPLVTTKPMQLVNFDQLAAGHNAIIAVMSFTGYDIEDAIILNQASVDRGFGRCIYTKTHTQELKMDYVEKENCELMMLSAELGPKAGKLLDEDGIVSPGCTVGPGDVLMVRGPSSAEKGSPEAAKTKPDQTRNKSTVKGCVQQVLLANDENGTRLVKVQITETLTPEIGDKFSSRHGQKGVVGLIVPQEDMPFTEQGIVPDLVMNPHGFPSRMTVGKMLELLGGKASILEGKFGDGSAFGGDPVEEMSRTLLRHGFHYQGKDYVTSGVTGEPIASFVFFGPVYYQKLKHMVYQKLQARARGPMTMLTRQPTEGRARGGGLRVGEMERDCFIAYGASSILQERLMLSSDAFHADVCGSCGGLARRKDKVLYCPICDSNDGIESVRIPYAFKLLMQELASMGVNMALNLVNDD